MCLVLDGDKVLLLNRPKSKGFPGYIGPGGKVDFPESLTEAAVREVYEETGLVANELIFKGIDEFVEPKENYRYMVFNYLATSFVGELHENPPEGELKWVSISEAMDLPMQPWFKRRLPMFFEEGTFEIHVVWDGENKEVLKETIKSL
ncbi:MULTISPECIES: 8-oxo-dGTP diphosphatase [Bacillus]|uniref:8-oxo-dGTP diphosphatase n=1 Tax=Bacillus TaxID=1386 RepID=UPI000BB71256|nr:MULTISPECIES: 8-oxo-dGTP diphosphatase [Bacillus]